VVSVTPRPHFTLRKDPVSIHRRLGGSQGRSERAKNLAHTGIRSPDLQARSQSRIRLILSYNEQIISFVSTRSATALLSVSSPLISQHQDEFSLYHSSLFFYINICVQFFILPHHLYLPHQSSYQRYVTHSIYIISR